MTRDQVKITLLHARIAKSNVTSQTILLVGIHELLYAIAEEMGVFEEDDDTEEEV